VSDAYWEEEVEKKDNYIQRVISTVLFDALPPDVENQIVDSENASDKVGQNPTDAYIAAILIKELKEMCSEEEKELLNLMYEEAKGREIAEVLDLSDQAARKRVQRLREKLQQRINGGGNGPPDIVLSPRKFSKGSVQPVEENLNSAKESIGDR
jgi:DNA-directed RNA polymerase specialized sigma24 family protein